MVKPLSTFVLIPILTLATSLGWSQQATTPSGAGVSATELARIQAYLDARYSAKDVVRTFETKLGQTVDCIDWFAQPGVRAMAAMGKPITKIPSPPQPPNGLAKAATIPDWAFNGAPDKNGVPRTCAPNGVAMVRVTAADIVAAGGLDAYTRSRKRLVAPPDNSENTPNYAHVRERFTGGGSNPAITYGQSVLSINDPIIPGTPLTNTGYIAGDHSVSQTWMTSGTGYNVDLGNGAPCPEGQCNDPGQTGCSSSACLQTVEVGWERDANNSPGGSHAYFFIFATNDGYNIICQGTNPCQYGNGSPVSPSQAAFVYSPGNWISDGTPLVDNPPGSSWQQWELQVVTFNDSAGTWWIWVNGGYIGYFRSTAMGWPTDFFTGTMRDTAQDFRAGGEVYDIAGTWAVPMGSGASPLAGFGQAAYMHDFMACALNQGCSYVFTPMGGARGAYDYSTDNPNPYWNNSFFFGNTPWVFWGQNYNYAPPQNSWAPQPSYVGQCGTSDLTGNDLQPVVGLSKYTNGQQQAHSILCGMYPFGDPSYPYCSNYTYVPFGYNIHRQNKQCSTDGDWDPMIAQGDCPCHDYVAGVVQDQGGYIEGILCCPGRYMDNQHNYHSLTHSGCEVETFYSSNSYDYYTGVLYSSPDWDPYYYKGQCPSGQYVAGISTVVYPLTGVPGAPHALHCCGS